MKEVKHILKGLVEVNQNVRSKIREAIRTRGYMMGWVAEQIETSPSQLSQWCRNKDGKADSTPHVVYILRLCKTLKCGVWDLFELIEEE